MSDQIRTIRVRTRPAYEVVIGEGLLDRCGPRLRETVGPCRMAVVTDSNVAPLYLERARASLAGAGFAVSTFVFPAGEGSKNFRTLVPMLEFLASERLTRSDCVAALGGGVTGDMAGLAAALYLRGSPLSSSPPPFWPRWTPRWGGRPPSTSKPARTWRGPFSSPPPCSATRTA